MACESCKLVVGNALTKLKIKPVRIALGEADINGKITPEQKQKLNAEIGKAGLELAEKKEIVIIEQIKVCVHEYLALTEPPKFNFSDYLQQKLKYDYNYLSNLFSQVEGWPIVTFLNRVKMEKAKELILFSDMTLTQIAEKLHYSHLSHFSSQFKKVTGFPPNHFKQLKENRRVTMQKLSGQPKKESKRKK
jgi:AraC-like DNA-binding protein